MSGKVFTNIKRLTASGEIHKDRLYFLSFPLGQDKEQTKEDACFYELKLKNELGIGRTINPATMELGFDGRNADEQRFLLLSACDGVIFPPDWQYVNSELCQMDESMAITAGMDKVYLYEKNNCSNSDYFNKNYSFEKGV